MKNTHTYNFSLLQYHHSLVLGEVLNIGLLIYFPIVNKLSFIYPKDMLRLKNIYTDFPEKTLNTYYDYFRQKVDYLNKNSDNFYKYELNASLKEFIEKEFLPADSSVLQFSDYKKAIMYTNDIQSLIGKLANLYFPSSMLEGDKLGYKHISDLKGNKMQKKEDWIKPDIKNKIVKIDKDFIFLPNRNDLLSF